MDLLRCKTADHDSAYGMSKVYFCCHPEDFEDCFDDVLDDIFKYFKCAVYYDDTGIERNDDYMFQLKDMRLFIMPVTKKLLTETNYALDREFAFAKERNIPILPLMQESGLDNLFNKKCGAIQYLDKNDKPQDFEKKLEVYLSSISSDADMAENIRKAFDAHIFLSYRKKDRTYARELMSLIHENDSLSGIAIWYDDYLVPGENYNDTIREAIRTSDVFVMAVTPNMVNERNYVSTCEYPEAVSSGKPIIPCEMIRTDGESLGEVFPGISASVDAHDKDAMLKRFLGVLAELNITLCERTPERDFLIGLAYLDGIDVEADSAKALRLITSAAERGYTDAIAKLSTMYQNGVGAEKNKKLAKKWRRQYVKITKAKLKESGSAEDVEAYLKALLFHTENGTAWDIISGLFKMRKEAVRLQGEDSFYNIFYYMVFGGWQAWRKGIDGADYYSKAIAILKNMPETQEIAEYICDVYTELISSISTAEKASERFLESAEKIVSEINGLMLKYNNSMAIKRSLNYVYRNISGESTLFIKKQPIEKLDASIERAKAFYEAVGDEGSKRMLAQCYEHAASSIAYTTLLKGRSEEEQEKITEYSRIALELSESLASQTKLLSDYERVIDILCSLPLRAENGEDTDKYSLRALEIAEMVGIRKLSAKCKKEIARIYKGMAQSLEKGSEQVIERYYDTSLMISDVLSGDFDKAMDAVDSREKESYAFYMKAISLREAIVRKDPGKDEYLLSDLLEDYCDMASRRWAFVDRELFARKAEEIFSSIPKKRRKLDSYKLKYMYLFMSDYESDPKKCKKYKKLSKKYK